MTEVSLIDFLNFMGSSNLGPDRRDLHTFLYDVLDS